MPILETSVTSVGIKYVGALLLAAGGITDGANIMVTGQSVLAQVGLPTEAQYGIAFGAICLSGYMGKLLLDYHKSLLKAKDDNHLEVVTELKGQIKDQKETIQKLVARLEKLQDAKD